MRGWINQSPLSLLERSVFVLNIHFINIGSPQPKDSVSHKAFMRRLFRNKVVRGALGY